MDGGDITPIAQKRTLSGARGSVSSTPDISSQSRDRVTIVPSTPFSQLPQSPLLSQSGIGTPLSVRSRLAGSNNSILNRINPQTPIEEYSPLPNYYGSSSQMSQNPYYDSSASISSRVDEELLQNGTNEDDLLNQRHLPETHIWGTDLNVQTCCHIFSNFIDNFRLSNTSQDPYYLTQLYLMSQYGDSHFHLDCSHLLNYDTTKYFYHQLVQYPIEIIPILDKVIQDKYISLFGEPNGNIRVHPYNLKQQHALRDIDPENIEQLISIQGLVVRVGAIQPELRLGVFRCVLCSKTINVEVNRGEIEEPSSCPDCQILSSMEILHNRCVYFDKQIVRVQEVGQSMPQGETPMALPCLAYDELVDTAKPGDRITVTGILRALPGKSIGSNPRHNKKHSVFRTYLEVIHFQKIGHGNINDSAIEQDNESAVLEKVMEASYTLTKNDIKSVLKFEEFGNERSQVIKQFHEFATKNVYDILVQSFAPSVWGLEDIKKGLLCQLFGGTIRRKNYKSQKKLLDIMNNIIKNSSYMTEEADDILEDLERDESLNLSLNINGEDDKQELEDTGGVHLRGDINILLCGDPGTSKSQLLTYVHRLSGRGVLASGKGSSAAGLTASLSKDIETGETVLEAGALVLSDGGICCLDEFDKLAEQARGALHEALEQQSVSVAKSGLVASLRARTALLACANPVESRYNPRKSIVENIKLPPSLISRFDLLFLILDKSEANRDRRLANHLVSMYLGDNDVEQIETRSENEISQTFLRSYISYARENCFPNLSEESEAELTNEYLAMRSGGGNRNTITATPRQLESLIRLSQALAKMRLSNIVTNEDVKEAARLIRVATQNAATDPRTGTIDLDLLTGGKSSREKDRIDTIHNIISELLKGRQLKGQRLTLGQLRQIISNDETYSASLDPPANPQEISQVLRQLAEEGLLQYMERTQTIIVRDS